MSYTLNISDFQRDCFPQRPCNQQSRLNNIAFYAYMSKSTPSISIQYPLAFDIVKTNNRNGYHASTGVFIALETGIYVFTWTIREYSNCRHSTQLMVNNAAIGVIHVDTGSSGDM